MDDPPEHIDRWRRGAEGERMTARELRGLSRRSDWEIRHDLSGRRGNRDHVIAGPRGVFLLETKRLGGDISIDDQGGLCVRWLEDPEDGYVNRHLARRLRGWAAGLSEEIGRHAGIRPWVEPVVVLWGRFDQEPCRVAGVWFVAGKQLAGWLEHAETGLAPQWRAPVTAVLTSLGADGVSGVPS